MNSIRFKQYYSVIVLLVAPLLLPLVTLQAQTTNTFSKSKVTRMVQAYGYILGQNGTLNEVKRLFPQYEREAKLAESEFLQFIGIGTFKKIQEDLKTVMGDYFVALESKVSNQLDKQVAGYQFDEHSAINYINEVRDRARGNIPSPILETLLSVAYKDEPHGEFLAGETQIFRTKGHAKAKETDWQVKVPLSWKAMEGDRPNIIQKFVSDYGDGDYMIALMVQDVELSDSEVDEFLSNENLVRDIFYETGKVIKYKKMVIDNFQGGMVEIEQVVERLDLKTNVRMQQYFAFKDGKMYIFQGAIGSVQLSVKDYDIAKEMAKYEPLFRLVANSIIINDQYTQK